MRAMARCFGVGRKIMGNRDQDPHGLNFCVWNRPGIALRGLCATNALFQDAGRHPGRGDTLPGLHHSRIPLLGILKPRQRHRAQASGGSRPAIRATPSMNARKLFDEFRLSDAPIGNPEKIIGNPEKIIGNPEKIQAWKQRRQQADQSCTAMTIPRKGTSSASFPAGVWNSLTIPGLSRVL